MCIAAVKEKDIDAKLKQVIAEWSAHNLAFGNFKSRGELLLRGEDTNEVIGLMEDSLMILSSLMSNRFVLGAGVEWGVVVTVKVQGILVSDDQPVIYTVCGCTCDN